MIAIKISCQCGQRYAFDAEPFNGRLTSAVACPVCGIDGTETANTFIAQNSPVPPRARRRARQNGALANGGIRPRRSACGSGDRG